MTWTCGFCGLENDAERRKCRACGAWGDHTYLGIADRIGKAARDGDVDRMTAEALVFRAKVVDDIKALLPFVGGDDHD